MRRSPLTDRELRGFRTPRRPYFRGALIRTRYGVTGTPLITWYGDERPRERSDRGDRRRSQGQGMTPAQIRAWRDRHVRGPAPGSDVPVTRRISLTGETPR